MSQSFRRMAMIALLALVLPMFGGLQLSAQRRPMVPPPAPTRTAAECVGVRAPELPWDSIPDFYPPAMFIELPPMPVPRQMRRATIEVRMLYRANGTIDSIQVLGASDSAYAARYLDALRRAAARRGPAYPATYQGCAVDVWVTTKATLDP